MAYALLSQITTQINTLFPKPSPPSSSLDQPPSHTLKLREDLEALQRMVQRIQAVLADAERREIHEELVKLWLRELSGLAYDADDVLDEYNYLVLRAQVEAGIQSDGASPSPPRKRKHPQEKKNLGLMLSYIVLARAMKPDLPKKEIVGGGCGLAQKIPGGRILFDYFCHHERSTLIKPSSDDDSCMHARPRIPNHMKKKKKKKKK